MNLKKTLIIVEGKADVSFIRDCLIHFLADFGKFEKFSLSEKSKMPICSFSNGASYHFLNLEGVSNLKHHIVTIKEYQNEGYQIVAFLDTDNTKSNGGRELKKNQIDMLKEKEKLNFEYYLLPFNDEIEGCLEDLLLTIANSEQFSIFNKCYEAYCSCLNESTIAITDINKREGLSELQEHKSVIYNYLQVFTDKKSAKEENRDYRDVNLWCLDHKNLINLKAFILKNCCEE